MKKILVLMVILLVGSLVFSIPASAKPASTASEEAIAADLSLAIKAPMVGFVGEKVEMKVVSLPGGEPAAGAGVWAVDINNGANLPVVSNTAADQIGVFLGRTGNSGELAYIFRAAGRYLLIAFKDGYQPGFSWIAIQPLKSMKIKGPEAAYVGQTVEFSVSDSNSGSPVAGAGVWALPAGDSSTVPGTEDDLLSFIINHGIFLGYTNNLGQVYHAFSDPGQYLLAALHEGYKPALGKIAIKELKQLEIIAPSTVRVLQQVNIRVVEEDSLPLVPVAQAGVWAISAENKADLKDVTDFNALVKSQGIFLGYTASNGYVMPKPRFSQAGVYWLIAIKDGYVPGISQIAVIGPTPPPTATPPKTSKTTR